VRGDPLGHPAVFQAARPRRDKRELRAGCADVESLRERGAERRGDRAARVRREHRRKRAAARGDKAPVPRELREKEPRRPVLGSKRAQLAEVRRVRGVADLGGERRDRPPRLGGLGDLEFERKRNPGARLGNSQF
jgi:hypothetical protein